MQLPVKLQLRLKRPSDQHQCSERLTPIYKGALCCPQWLSLALSGLGGVDEAMGNSRLTGDCRLLAVRVTQQTRCWGAKQVLSVKR
jgi:hypothetical protein